MPAAMEENVYSQRSLTKTMFMRNGRVSDASFSLNGTNISECSSYVYLGREVNVASDLSPQLGRRNRADWGGFNSVEELLRKTRTSDSVPTYSTLPPFLP
ncbi:unnamed protein product [Heligmosomoides polygyrus]|uniref:Uncharacterized protein n=1 Tax=Heligmosomoides polygyrus TaxID=6339 RepID=A0A183FNB0_HELPZ|nr:unnamed protein product [Heligmosomoides polygyrus]